MSAIASKPSASYRGYILGGLMWFCIPFTLATSLGLGAIAMDLPLTASEAGSGLVPPATAVYILGKGGAVWVSESRCSSGTLPCALVLVPDVCPAGYLTVSPPAVFPSLMHFIFALSRSPSCE